MRLTLECDRKTVKNQLSCCARLHTDRNGTLGSKRDQEKFSDNMLFYFSHGLRFSMHLKSDFVL